MAARRNKTAISYDEVDYAIDRLTVGMQKTQGTRATKNKESTAYYEAATHLTPTPTLPLPLPLSLPLPLPLPLSLSLTLTLTLTMGQLHALYAPFVERFYALVEVRVRARVRVRVLGLGC